MKAKPAHHQRLPVEAQKCSDHTAVIATTPTEYDAVTCPASSGPMTKACIITVGSKIGIHIMAYHDSDGTGCLRHMNLPVLTISRK